jgi:hypothetical protein
MSNNYALGFPTKIKTNPIIIAGAKYSNEYFPISFTNGFIVPE